MNSQTNLNLIEEDLQTRIQDLELEADLIKTKHSLRKIQNYKIQDQKERSKLNQNLEGDRGSKYFFNIIKAKNKREFIEHIHFNGGKSQDPELMQSAFFEYYSQLLSSEMFDANYEALDKCLQLIPKKVLEEDSNRLNNPITLEEVKWLVNSLANDKSP